MNLDDFVTSFDECKQLKAAGYPQKAAAFYWNTYNATVPDLFDAESREAGLELFGEKDAQYFVAAPTLEEMLRTLPVMMQGKPDQRLHILRGREGKGWIVAYPGSFGCEGGSIADAAAGMYCCLKEHRLL